jgi:hypothetical protein
LPHWEQWKLIKGQWDLEVLINFYEKPLAQEQDKLFIDIERNWYVTNMKAVIEEAAVRVENEERGINMNISDITHPEKKFKDYSKMSKWDIQREVDDAIDHNDKEKLKKLAPYVIESLKIKINEAITRSYLFPMSKEKVASIIKKMIIKHQQTALPIKSMKHWLDLNNFGSYSDNKWIRAIVDTLFRKMGGSWERINTSLSIDQLTNIVMNYWQKKLTKESLNEIIHFERGLNPKASMNIGGIVLGETYDAIMKEPTEKWYRFLKKTLVGKKVSGRFLTFETESGKWIFTKTSFIVSEIIKWDRNGDVDVKSSDDTMYVIKGYEKIYIE